MPQFDFYAFSTQIFWSLILFYAFYFFLTQVYLPKITTVLKLREKRKLIKYNKETVSIFSLLLLYII